MKLKDGVLIQEMDGKFVAVDAGSGPERFHGIVNMNHTAAFVARQLQKDRTTEELVEAMTQEYDVTPEVARENIEKMIGQLTEIGLITEG